MQNKQRQRALLSGLFHRMEAATFRKCVSALLPTLVQLEAEVVAFGYSSDMFAQCLKAFAYSRLPAHSQVWISLCQRFLKAKLWSSPLG
jgi:hypothetical protein